MAAGGGETPAALFGRLFSYYRESFPASAASFLPLCVVGGFEKVFGTGRIVCVHCHFPADCRVTPTDLDNAHYAFSAACQMRRLDSGPLDSIMLYLQSHLCYSTFSDQFYFEDEFLRQCSLDADFRELTFAYGQWRNPRGLKARELSQHGFYCSIKKHSVKCVGCLRTLDNPQTIRNLKDWHVGNSPKCPFVQRAMENNWENLRFEHDQLGFVIDSDLEVMTQSSSTTPASSKLTFPISTMSTTVAPRTFLTAKRMPRKPMSSASSSLVTLFGALNSCGITDSEARKAILAQPKLIQARSAAQFLQALTPAGESNVEKPTAQIETDLRAGQMATVTDSQCSLCVSREKDAVFLPCRHVFACYVCACRIRDGATPLDRRCCLCRQEVKEVTQLLLTSTVTYY